MEATVSPFLFLFYFSPAQLVMLNLQCLVTKQLENLVNGFTLKCHQVFLEKKNDLMRMTQLLVSSNIKSLCKANSSAKVTRRICLFACLVLEIKRHSHAVPKFDHQVILFA